MTDALVQHHLEAMAVRPLHVRRLIESRRARSVVFGADLFADPGWDILLNVYLADLQGEGVAITKVCDAVPPMTTTLRWISRLENDGLIARAPDPSDKRRAFLSMTGRGRTLMAQYFSEHPLVI